jgi:hypothetical protein
MLTFEAGAFGAWELMRKASQTMAGMPSLLFVTSAEQRWVQ